MDEGTIPGTVGALYRERLTRRLGGDLFGYLEATLRAVAPAVEFRAADLARAAGGRSARSALRERTASRAPVVPDRAERPPRLPRRSVAGDAARG